MKFFSKRLLLIFFFFLMNDICAVDPLKILFVAYYFPHLSQVFVQDQIVTLIKNGHLINIHSFDKQRHKKIQSDVKKYELISKTTYGKNIPNLNSHDIIYVQFGNLGPMTIRQARKSGFKGKLVVCFRGNDLTGYVNRDPHRYDELFKSADLFLPVCDYFKQKLIVMGCDEKKILVHHSAIDTKKFAFKDRKIHTNEPITLVTVARLTEKKGIVYAIEAVAQVVKKYPNVRYIIVGDEDRLLGYRKKVEDLIVAHHLEDNVRLFGWATHEEVLKVLDLAHIFILPCVTAASGDQEGIPNALKEAMAVGIPVITTYHAGNAELVEDGESGFLIQEKDSDALANRIIHLIEHKKTYNRFAKNGRKKIVSEFDIKKTVQRLESIFHSLIDKESHS
jgi:colanic acid/amylovoran biosynthesis glycosyltransferase